MKKFSVIMNVVLLVVIIGMIISYFMVLKGKQNDEEYKVVICKKKYNTNAFYEVKIKYDETGKANIIETYSVFTYDKKTYLSQKENIQENLEYNDDDFSIKSFIKSDDMTNASVWYIEYLNFYQKEGYTCTEE